jgi:hypothetical protein
MPLQSSGAIQFSDLQSEFGGTNPISLSEYYRSAGLVDRTVTNVPTTGAISMGNFYSAANAVGLTVVTSKTGTSASGTGTVVMPTGIIAGDIIIVGYKADYGSSISSYPGSGFTRVSSAGATNGASSDSGTIISYKVATGSESGATIGGWADGSGPEIYAIYVVRPSRTLRSITAVNTGSYAGTSDPPAYTITTASAADDATTIALSFMGGWGTGINGSFSPTTTRILDYDIGGSDVSDSLRLYMYIQNPALVTPVNCVTNFNNSNVNSYSTGYIAIR